MFLVVIFFIILFSRKSFIFRHTSFSIFFLNLSPYRAEDPSENKEENPSCHSHYQDQFTWHGRLWPPLISCPAHSNSFDNIYVFQFSGISSFCFSFIQMNNITRTRTRGKEGVFGGEFGRTFSCIFIKNAIEKHPGNFMVLGVLIYPLDYLIRIIRFVLFRIIEFGRIYSTSRTLVCIISTGHVCVNL